MSAERGKTLQSSQDRATGTAPPIVDRIEQAIAAKDWDGAAQLARQAIDAGRVHPLFFESRGHWKGQCGLLKESLDDFRRAHALAPKSTRILCGLAAVLNALERPRLAILACGDALAIDPALAEAWFQKGRAHRRLGQLGRAGDCFMQAVRHDPDMAPAHAQLADLSAL